MKPFGWITSAAALAFALGGCDLLTFGLGPPGATPYPTLPATVPAPMAAAIAVAEPYVADLSRTLPVVTTAFPVDLATECGDNDGMCPGVTGPGWGVVLAIMDPDNKPSQVLVILDADANVLFTSQ
jgi:hypothetical protein